MEERIRRELWAIDSDSLRVVQVTGYACDGYDPAIWWVPDLRVSLTEGYGAFDTEDAAKARAREVWEAKRQQYTDALEILYFGNLRRTSEELQ